MTPGTISRVNGPVVEVQGLEARMLELVEVGGLRPPVYS